ncbi:hypothetical protein [Mycolicibacterium sp. XJ1819]
MKNLIARVIGLVAIAAAAAAGAMIGAGNAAADPLIGKTYEQASSTISKNWNANPVIATVSGNQLPTPKCIVTSWNRSSSKSALTGSTGRKILVNLNCNEKVAQPGQPGNSVMTPQGRQGKSDIKNATNLNKNPKWCQSTEERLGWCKRFCARTGLCEFDPA